MEKKGSDFNIPDEILSVIPTDPYDQLDLARKITSMAIASRVSQLEMETSGLRVKIEDKDQVISELQDRIAELDRLLQQSDSRLSLALKENLRLAKERDTLAITAKKLSRDLAKLETFKRQLMLSLSADNLSVNFSNSEVISIFTLFFFYIYSLPLASICVRKNVFFFFFFLLSFICLCHSKQKEIMEPLIFLLLEYLHGKSSLSRTSWDAVIGSSETEESREEINAADSKFSITPYITPRLTPNATPRVSSTAGSPRGFSSADSSPKFSSSATSTKFHFEDQGSMPSWYPSSQQTSASNSAQHPLQARKPRIDGKEFFRQARTRLSYEQFGAFLANIKELNAHRKSREETLVKAEEIFGAENKDLYISFQRLLSRNLT